MAPEGGEAGALVPDVRVGVFGGPFDPPHVGHLVVARDVAEALHLDRMVWMPAGSPPHKQGEPISSPALRLDMTRAAVHGEDGFEVSDLEVRREGPSYTVDTLRTLREREPDVRLHLVMGADQFASFGTWRKPAEITRLARLAVMDRGGTEADRLDPGIDAQVDVVPVTRLDISSTDVRTRVRQGRSVRHLVPDAVRRIIEDRGLYARGS